MKKTPIVSIIVPIYRTEQYIHRCLDSIASQTNQHFEAILMDDGSDDHCPSICDEYVAKYPDIFKVVHQKNQGISIVRNNGIKLSSGKFITFIDSDDYVSSTFIEDLIQGQSFNNADLTICSYKKESNQHLESHIFHSAHLKNDQLYKLITEHNILPQCYTWNKLYKKEIILKHNLRFEPKVSLAEDAIFLFQYLLHINNIELINKENYYYQVSIRDNNLMSIKRDFKERLSNYQYYYTNIKKLEQYLNNKEVTKNIGKHLSIMIDRQIQSIYKKKESHINRIAHLKQIDLKTYALHRKGWSLVDSALVWLLTHRFYHTYDFIMNYISHRNE